MTTTKTERSVMAWHFLRADGCLRNGKKPPANGEWLRHDGAVEICESGLHASRSSLDALTYAPGPIVCRVECRRIEDSHSDKIVCCERRIVWRADATATLREFARWCALRVLHLWDAPEVVVAYLRSGDESLRAAAAGAAWDARDAARDAAGAAARDAAWAAAWAARAAAGAAGAAAWDARDAARDAAGAAARDAAWAASRRRLRTMLLRLRPEEAMQ